MAQFIRTQTVAGAGQDFDGSAGTGLFLFEVSQLPLDHIVTCQQLGIFGLAATATWVMAYFAPPGLTGKPILIGAADATALAGLDGNLAVKFCPGVVPRSSGSAFWSIKIYSAGLSDETTATLCYSTGTS